MASSQPTPKSEAPRICLLSASTRAFMKPRLSPFSRARLTRVMGRVAMRMGLPNLRASASVMPMRARGGSQYMA